VEIPLPPISSLPGAVSDSQADQGEMLSPAVAFRCKGSFLSTSQNRLSENIAETVF